MNLAANVNVSHTVNLDLGAKDIPPYVSPTRQVFKTRRIKITARNGLVRTITIYGSPSRAYQQWEISLPTVLDGRQPLLEDYTRTVMDYIDRHVNYDWYSGTPAALKTAQNA